MKLLYPPRLPQMDDGVINNSDLNSQQALEIIILPYENTRIGDYIKIYLDGKQIISKTIESLSDLPWASHFDISNLPDGNYIVNYDVTSAVGNWNQSTPSVAVIIREDTGELKAPKFTDVDSSGVLSNISIFENNGTHISIPNYDNISTRDNVEIHVISYDENGNVIGNGHYIEHHIVQESDLATGFVIKEPAVRILIENSFRLLSYYIVSPIIGNIRVSHQSQVYLENSNRNIPAPEFPDAVFGWLTNVQLVDEIRSDCGNSQILEKDALITFSYQGLSLDGKIIPGTSGNLLSQVTESDIDRGFIEFLIDNVIGSKIKIGRIEAFYEMKIRNETYFSAINSVGLDSTHNNPLPPPLFTQASNNILKKYIIENDGMVVVHVTSSNLSQGEIITLYGIGTDDNHNIIEGSSYSEPKEITQQDILNGYCSYNLPISVVLLSGDKGFYTCQYTIQYNNGGFSYSDVSEVMMDFKEDEPILFLNFSTGAPSIDLNTISLTPENRGVIKGEPGMNIELSCSAPAYFTQNNSNTMSVTLDSEGLYPLAIRSPIQESIMVYAFLRAEPAKSDSVDIAFRPYRVGHKDIIAIGNSTGAPNIMNTPCSIYLVANKTSLSGLPITKVHAVVDGNATFIENGKQEAIFYLSNDQSAQIDIVNSHPEKNTVILSLPESTGSSTIVSVVFEPLSNNQ